MNHFSQQLNMSHISQCKPLVPKTLSNVDAIRAAEKVANEKLALARTAMPRIESVMETELQKIEKLGKEVSPGTSGGLSQGVKERQGRYLPLLRRHADLNVEWFEKLTATLSFLSSLAGTYEVADDGTVLFQTTLEADRYNAQLSKLQTIAAQQEKLDQNIREENERTTEGWRRFLSGSEF